MSKTINKIVTGVENFLKYGHSKGIEHLEWYRKKELSKVANEAMKNHNDSMDAYSYSASSKFNNAVEFIEEAVSDTRYNTPKEKHKASDEEIDHVLATTPIYQRANERLNKGQRGQIGYGIDKYPEPLNADTWTIFETLDHIMDESIDKMHYTEMLREKFEAMIGELEGLKIWKLMTERELEELEELRKFKRAVEKDWAEERTAPPEPIKLYADNHIYPYMIFGEKDGCDLGTLSSAIHTLGESSIEQYPKSDINHPENDSTYIKNCKAATMAELEAHLQEKDQQIDTLKEEIKAFEIKVDLLKAEHLREIARHMLNAMEQEQLNRRIGGM